MKFSSIAFLALPLLGAAAAETESPFEEYKAQFQTYFDKFSGYIPNPNRQNLADIVEAKIGEKQLSILTLDNWKQTLYESVKPDQKEPEEWWVLISGRNKTCFGRCGQVEQAFNETAAKFAVLPNTPHMALLNCDDQPVLCNVFSAGPSTIWAVDLLPPGNRVDVFAKRLNTTTTTSQDLVDLQARGDREEWREVTSVFHPWNGPIAENGLSLPVAWTLWAFSIFPNWVVMIVISMVSRRAMGRRMDNPPAGGAAPAR